MAPYAYMFGTTRIPTISRDDLSLSPRSNHIVVLSKGTFHRVTVRDENGAVYDDKTIDAALTSIMDNCYEINGANGSNGANDDSIAVLSTQDRDVWAKHRQILVSKGDNGAKLNVIDTALFVVNLDDTKINNEHDESRVMLHGENGNSWYDKHCLIRMSNGKIALNYEHSFSDGMIWNRMLSEVLADVDGKELKGYSKLVDGVAGKADVEALHFEIDDSIRDAIKTASDSMAENIANCHSHFLNFNAFGKAQIKKWKVSPDSAVQMAYQLAYFKMHNKLPTVYESCATRGFDRGRTEVIRSLSVESGNFVDGMVGSINDKNSSVEARREAFTAACERHIEIAKFAKSGMGVDRHLMVLGKLAAEGGIEHELFDDDVFKQSSTWILSTSNVSAPFIDRFGFGAVTGSGYGLGYVIHDDDVPVNVTCFRDGGTDSEKMANSIDESLKDIKKLFD
jgi:hypothetical protein